MTTDSKTPSRCTYTCILFLLSAGLLQIACLSKSFPVDKESRLRAMWFWHTEEMLKSPSGVEDVLSFAVEHNIDHLFVQILTKEDAGVTQISDPAEMRAFISLATELGIKIHALDGAPNFALSDNHDTVLSKVQAVLDFNETANASERFHAVRMDIEPYALKDEWDGKKEDKPHEKLESRQAIIESFLEINQSIVDLIAQDENPIDFGIDIPFWYDKKKQDGTYEYTAEHNGEYANLATHLIRMVDNVGLMAYRNNPTGSDSTLELSSVELEIADHEDAATVFIGFETKLPDGEGIPKNITFGHLTSQELEEAITKLEAAASEYESFSGVAIHHYKSLKALVNKASDNSM